MDEELLAGSTPFWKRFVQVERLIKYGLQRDAQKQFSGPIVAEAKNLGIIVQFTRQA